MLETQELYQLDAVQKLQILKGLCLRIMGTYSVQDFMEEKQQECSRLWWVTKAKKLSLNLSSLSYPSLGYYSSAA